MKQGDRRGRQWPKKTKTRSAFALSTNPPRPDIGRRFEVSRRRTSCMICPKGCRSVAAISRGSRTCSIAFSPASTERSTFTSSPRSSSARATKSSRSAASREKPAKRACPSMCPSPTSGRSATDISSVSALSPTRRYWPTRWQKKPSSSSGTAPGLNLLLHPESSADRLTERHQHDQQGEYEDAERAQLGERSVFPQIVNDHGGGAVLRPRQHQRDRQLAVGVHHHPEPARHQPRAEERPSLEVSGALL